jgi:hypothetical protein
MDSKFLKYKGNPKIYRKFKNVQKIQKYIGNLKMYRKSKNI